MAFVSFYVRSNERFGGLEFNVVFTTCFTGCQPPFPGRMVLLLWLQLRPHRITPFSFRYSRRYRNREQIFQSLLFHFSSWGSFGSTKNLDPKIFFSFGLRVVLSFCSNAYFARLVIAFGWRKSCSWASLRTFKVGRLNKRFIWAMVDDSCLFRFLFVCSVERQFRGIGEGRRFCR